MFRGCEEHHQLVRQIADKELEKAQIVLQMCIRDSREPVRNSGMLVDGEHIAAVGSAVDFSSYGADREVVDCLGKTIMPGMINGHVHFLM